MDIATLRTGDRVRGECGGEGYTATITAPSRDGAWLPVRYDDGTEDLAHRNEIIEKEEQGMSVTKNGTEQKILSVVGTLAAPVSRTAIVKAAGIADGSNVTRALARLETAGLIASTREGRSVLYGPVAPEVAEDAASASSGADRWEIGGAPEHAGPSAAEIEAMYVERDGVSPQDPPVEPAGLTPEDAPAVDCTDMSPDEVARLLMHGSPAMAEGAKAAARAMSIGQRAAIRAAIMATMPSCEDRLRLLFETGLQPTRQEAEEAKAANARKRAAAGGTKRAPKERPLLNTTERYIVNTLAFHGSPMTRKEIDQACKLRGGSIAGHAVKKAYPALVERGMIARTGEGDSERFRITGEGREKYVATLGGKPVELLVVPRWVPPAKREQVTAD